MASRKINDHLSVLLVCMDLEKDDFIKIVQSSANGKIDKRMIEGWFEGTKAQDRSLQRLCDALKKFSGNGEVAVSHARGCPEQLSSMDISWFDRSPSYLNDILQAPSKPKPKTGPHPTFPSLQDGIGGLFVLLRAIRRSSVVHPSIALELLYIGTPYEPDAAGSPMLRCAMLTRLGRLYHGTARVSASNVYLHLLWDENAHTLFSVRNLNLKRPLRADHPKAYGGLLQRSTSSNSDPSSCVVAALRLPDVIDDGALHKRASELLHKTILMPERTHTIDPNSVPFPLLGTIDAQEQSVLHREIEERLVKMIDYRDLEAARADGRDKSALTTLSIKTVSAEEVSSAWLDFRLISEPAD